MDLKPGTMLIWKDPLSFRRVTATVLRKMNPNNGGTYELETLHDTNGHIAPGYKLHMCMGDPGWFLGVDSDESKYGVVSIHSNTRKK